MYFLKKKFHQTTVFIAIINTHDELGEKPNEAEFLEAMNNMNEPIVISYKPIARYRGRPVGTFNIFA